MTDFVEWNGGDCPLPKGVAVQVKYRDGYELTMTSGEVRWSHSNAGFDVVAYKPLYAHEKQKTLRDEMAMAALANTHTHMLGGFSDANRVAVLAYALADAMLAEREK